MLRKYLINIPMLMFYYLVTTIFLQLVVTPIYFFNDKLSYLNLFQYNHICNVNNSILDYVLSNSLFINVIENNCPIVPVDLFHPPFTVTYTYKCVTELEYYDYVFNWNAGDYTSIVSYLGSIDWSNLFNCNFNINDSLDYFYSHID